MEEQNPLAPLSKATGISAQPEKPLPFTIIDFLSGGLTDPEGWRFDSREENGMKVAQALTALLGAKIPRSTNTNMRNFDHNVPPVDMTLNTRKFLPPQNPNQSLAQTEQNLPRLAGFQNTGSTAYMQFDRNGPKITAEQLKAMLPEHRFEVQEFAENVLSPHIRKFRLDVFDENGRLSSEAAKKLQAQIGDNFHDWERPLNEIGGMKSIFGSPERNVTPRPMVPPEFTPVGGEQIYNQTLQKVLPPAPSSDNFYQQLLKLFGGLQK